MHVSSKTLLRAVAVVTVGWDYFGASVVAQQSTDTSTNSNSGSGSPGVVCIAGQCLQGFTNVSIGAVLSADGAPTSIHLLPGTYTTTTSPQLLHDILVSSSASLSTSAGFENITTPPFSSSFTLPLDVKLQPGMAVYTLPFYGGDAGYSSLQVDGPIANDTQVQLTAGSIALSENVWFAIRTSSRGSSTEQRIVIWESIPDVNQLPQLLPASGSSSSRSLTLVDMQLSSCSPSCSSSGVCSPLTSTCICQPNFTGPSCEQCAPGHFGPECRPCPQSSEDGGDCEQCDEGIQGTGVCLRRVLGGDERPANCECENGRCGRNGECECLEGWQDGDDGRKCSTCKRGFFLTSTGDCQVCQLGCDQCADTTGACLSCKPRFSLNPSDRTSCDPPPNLTSSGQQCGDGSFGDGPRCSVCSPACRTCTGRTSSDCTLCAQGTYFLNGSCVRASADGVCEGTTLIADNLKNECDSCGSKCTTCRIQGFNVASTPDQIECTGCLPGFVLSGGQCVESCPAGTIVSPQDNFTCIPCSSTCGTCAGTPDFCLTCSGSNQLAFNGRCVSSCPPGSFSSTTPSSGSSNVCLNCHPDCASCSGSSFNQCTSCPPHRPVLTDGRCLPTCTKSQYFDGASGSCRDCDTSCGSCSGPGRNECLSCNGDDRIIQGGSCVSVDCRDGLGQSQATGGTTGGLDGGAGVIPGLGVCLSQIVRVPPPSSPDSPEPPLPTITGLDNPTVVDEPKQSLSLEWWQILLMALGCAFIVLLILMCWRRRARKKREERTKMFAEARGLNDRSRVWGWGWRLRRFFGGGSRTTPYDKGAGRGKDGYRDADEDTLEGGRYRDDPDYYVYGDDASTVMKMKTMGKGRGGGSQRTLDDGESMARKTTKSDLSQFIDAYDYSARRSTTSRKSRAQSRRYREDTYTYRDGEDDRRDADGGGIDDGGRSARDRFSRQRRIRELLDGASLYSEFTQKPRNAPDTRQPVKSSAGWGGPGDSASASKGIRPLDPLPGPGARELEKSRFSVSTIGSSWFPNRYGREGNLISVDEDVPPVPTEAQAYAMSVKPELMASIGGGAAGDSSRGGYWIQPDLTGTTALSTSSNNPFRQREYQKQQGLS